MMSMEMRAAHAWAEEEDKKLRADDERFNRFVYLVHDDGSTMLFSGAFAVRYPGNNDFICIFTEHQGFHVQAFDDLYRLWMFESVGID